MSVRSPSLLRVVVPLLVSSLLALVACSRPNADGHGSSGSTSTATTTPPGPATPCQSDADCRLVACQGCSCRGVHRSDPDGCLPAVCVAWPCSGMAATCDAAKHTCTTKKAPPADAAAAAP